MKRVWVLVFATWLSISAVGAWGQNGHRIVAEIADGLLSPEARAAVRRILGEESLAEVSNWPDEIRSDDAWSCASPFHYVTVPPGTRYPAPEQPDWRRGDAVRAVYFWAQRLIDPQTTDAARRNALRFLVHVVGDLHQPLHVGQGCDQGGNDLSVLWFGEERRLHSVWDEGVVESANLSFTEYVRFLQLPADEEREAVIAAGPDAWIVESQALHRDVYRCDTRGDRCPCYCGECGDGFSRFGGCASVGSCQLQIGGPVRLAYAYKARVAPLVDRQLVKGGLRLAALLNSILADDARLPDSYRELESQLGQIPDWDVALKACLERPQ